MSSMMNKIADAITGHHTATNTTANPTGTNTGLGNNAAVGSNYAGTNYSAADNGALKEGAQVRDTGARSAANALDRNNNNNNTHNLHNTHSTTNPALGSAATSSHLGRDAALGAGAGSALASGHHHGLHSGSNSSLYSGSNSSLASGSSSSLAGSSLGSSSSYGTQQRSGAYEGAAGSSDDAMTRSEEHLLVGKEKVNVGKAVLNKYVTTEKVSTAVPIIRERAVIEREPITEANRGAALRGPDFKESTYEVNLMEERAVAEKETVPIERVRLRKEVEQTQQYVEAELRKEHIELVDGTRDTGLGAGKQYQAGGLNNNAAGSGGRQAGIDATSQSGLGNNSALGASSGLGNNSGLGSNSSARNL